jgi:hypothetical protein
MSSLAARMGGKLLIGTLDIVAPIQRAILRTGHTEYCECSE